MAASRKSIIDFHLLKPTDRYVNHNDFEKPGIDAFVLPLTVFEENTYNLYIDLNGATFKNKSDKKVDTKGRYLIGEVKYTDNVAGILMEAEEDLVKSGCYMGCFATTKNGKSALPYKSRGKKGENTAGFVTRLSNKNNADVVVYPIWY